MKHLPPGVLVARSPLDGALALAALVVAAAASGLGAGEPSFTRFSYEQHPAFGFCPALDAVFRAEIERDASGAHRVTLTVLEVVPRDVAGDACIDVLDEIPEGSCARARQLPARTLTADEVARLAQTFNEVTPRLLMEPDPLCGAIDPCTVHDFVWDDIEATDEPCSNTRLTFEDTELLERRVEDLRVADPAIENGDTNGDGRRDLSDGIYLLLHLFLGGAAPVSGSCPELPPCLVPQIVVVENGDTNGDSRRDVADAVTLLEWLFRAGRPPVPLCFCADSECDDEACPDAGACIPLPPALGGTICTRDLESCRDVERVYEALTGPAGSACRPEIGCHILFGHCGVGLGGCYYAVSRTVRQEHLDALSERYIELDGLATCASGVCRCARPPERAVCIDGECQFDP